MMLSGFYPALAQGQDVDAKIKEIDAKMKDLERLKSELEQLRGQLQQSPAAKPEWTEKVKFNGYFRFIRIMRTYRESAWLAGVSPRLRSLSLPPWAAGRLSSGTGEEQDRVRDSVLPAV